MSDVRSTPEYARLANYIVMRRAQPLKGLDDSIHCIHTGTDFAAELNFSDLVPIIDALARLTRLYEASKQQVKDGQEEIERREWARQNTQLEMNEREAEIERLKGEIERDAGDAATMRGFINTYQMTPSMMASKASAAESKLDLARKALDEIAGEAFHSAERKRGVAIATLAEIACVAHDREPVSDLKNR